ncbi:MAG: hemin uptake protein HemP [Polynucleobacter sp.]|nr:MAG: hemin uptake protein HemP [Polynucleobacter sp.]
MQIKKKDFLTREIDNSEAPQASKAIDIKPLMGEQNYIDLIHEGERYRLRVTKYRKLILTK